MHVVLVSLKNGFNQKSFPAYITNKGSLGAVESFVELQIIFVVKLFLALITRELCPDLVLELEMVAASPRNGERFLAQQTTVDPVLLLDEGVDLALLWVLVGHMAVQVLLGRKPFVTVATVEVSALGGFSLVLCRLLLLSAAGLHFRLFSFLFFVHFTVDFLICTILLMIIDDEVIHFTISPFSPPANLGEISIPRSSL